MKFKNHHTKYSNFSEQNVLFGLVLVLFQVLPSSSLNAQPGGTDSFSFSKSPNLSPMLSTHPFGMYYARMAPNFKYNPGKQYTFSLELNNGNVWLPPVKAYMPLLKTDQEEYAKYPWYLRYGEFEENPIPVDSSYLEVDAVYHVVYASLSQTIGKNHEINLRLRAFRLDKGDSPLTILTSDKAIEWFHSKIQGQEDPFARKIYGLNKERFNYTDRDGKSFSPQFASWYIPGLELAYYFYPWKNSTATGKLTGNFGTQLGMNFGPVNSSVDLGFAGNMLRKYKLTSKQNLHLSMHLGVLQKGLFKKKNNLNLSNSPRFYTYHIQSVWEYKRNDSQSFFIGLGYNIHSPYNRLSERRYVFFDGEGYTPHWNYALGHLYRFDFSWNFQLAYSWPNTMLSFFMREDVPANNAPDIQTGFRLLYHLNGGTKEDK